jgi:hypothetical protein
MPTTSLTDDIYGPGSTGADGAFQYGPNWWRTTYNRPGGVVCWYQGEGSGISGRSPIANIPSPLP